MPPTSARWSSSWSLLGGGFTKLSAVAGAVVLLDEDRIPLIVRDCAKPSNERKGGRGERHWEKNPLYITRYPPRQWPPRAAPRERIVWCRRIHRDRASSETNGEEKGARKWRGRDKEGWKINFTRWTERERKASALVERFRIAEQDGETFRLSEIEASASDFFIATLDKWTPISFFINIVYINCQFSRSVIDLTNILYYHF